MAPLLAFLWPSNAKIKRTQVPITLSASLDQITAGQAVRFDAPPNSGFVMADGGGDNYAGKIAFSGFLVSNASKAVVFATTCSHLGCSVNFNADAKRFECPCHGSVFAINGDVLHGPAASPLSHLTWSQGQDATQILVDGYTGIT